MTAAARASLVALALGVLSSSPGWSASLRVQGFSHATNDPDVQDLVDQTAATGPLPAGATSAGAATSGGGAASGQVSGEADYGMLRVRASGTASGPFLDIGGGVSGGSIQASWTDRFAIEPADPDLLFQPGTFVIEIELGGSLAADAGGASHSNTRAQYGLYVDAGSCSSGCDFQRFGEQGDFGLLDGGEIFTGDPIARFTSPPVPFAFGIGIDLSVALSAVAQAVAGEEVVTSSADANLEGTLAWAGIAEVRDGADELVTEYSVTSESGVDWSQPVPEPTGGPCAMAALVGLAGAARRRARTAL
jgi:MYXO-CTERM domain-containing protein